MSVMDDIAGEVETDTPPPADALEAAQRLGAEYVALMERIERGTALLKTLNDRKEAITGRELVELMDEKKIENLQVEGWGFKPEPYYKASIPEDNREEAHKWLEDNGAGDLINNTIIISLPADNEEEAKEIERYVRERWQQATVERKQLVPWARLTSWIKELFEKPDPDKILPPLDLMGAKVGRYVKVKPPKKNK